jgi:carbon monoxide dehydrogenase subunit G
MWLFRFVVLVVLVLSSVGVARAQGEGGFSAAEREALQRGEIVRRVLRSRSAGHRTYGGVSFLWIDAPIDEVWATASDPDALTELIPTLASARVVEEASSERLLRMHHSYGVGETDYYMRMTLDHERRAMRFAIDSSRPHDVRSGNGFLQLSRHRTGTMVTWGMRMDPGVGILGELFSSMLDAWLLKPPLCLRDAVAPGVEPSC